MNAAERPAVAERHAEGLRLHADDVRLDGRANHAQRDRFGNGHNEQRSLGMGDLGDGRNIFNDAKEVGALDQDGGGFLGDGGFQRGQIDAAGLGVVTQQRAGQALVLGIGGHHFAVLGMNGRGDHGLVPPGDAHGHHDGFGCAGRAVVHAGVGHVHAGQLGDHGLELEDGLQRALRDLGLVGRVAGEKLAALHQGVDNHRPVVAIGARAQEAGVVGGVFAAGGAEVVDDLALGVLRAVRPGRG